jgi:hypothetical protein
MSSWCPGRLLRAFALTVGVAGLAAGAIAFGSVPGLAAAESGVPEPVLGQRETLRVSAGTVTVRAKGGVAFSRISGPVSVPDESEVDASHGSVAVTAATPQPGQTATAEASQGRFLLHQDLLAPAETHLILSQPLPSCGPPRLPRKAAKAGAAAARKQHGRPSKSRHLWVGDHGGSWGTNGRYVSTTVEGTRWLTSDECRQSNVKVTEGVVVVHDLIHATAVTIAAGHEYVAAQPPAEGAGFVPPLGEVLTGETGGDPAAFQQQVGKHVAVFGYFGSWGGEFASLLAYVRSLHARLLLHLSTDIGYGSGAGQEISPAGIASGHSDDYLVRLCEELATSEAPVYLALLPEMNQANNAYSAFNANGSSRGASNSTAAFRQAWRRTVLILRGGAVSVIDRRLRALRLPVLRTSLTALPIPRVSFMWAPQTAGTPDTPANAPAAYYPGAAYVDIVGTDFYSAYPNFRGLQALYAAYPSKPFGFNEWAMWQNGDPGFVRQLFAFVRGHRRIALMVYNEGLSSDGPFRLKRFPAATGEIRRQLSSPRFLGYAPE